MDCNCTKTPRHRMGIALNTLGARVYAFNMDCPEHGIGEPNYRPMREVWRRGWMTLMQALSLRGKVDDIRVIRREGNQALMEWLDYEFFPLENLENKS